MQLSVVLLLLQLVGKAIVFAQSDCSALPDVPNAQLSGNSSESGYKNGVTVSFTCETGYISGRQIRFVCSNGVWKPHNQATCRLKPCVLPDDIINGYYQIVDGEDFVYGTKIQYFCNDGYHIASKEDTRTCLINEWSNHLPVCEPLSCEAPHVTPGLTVNGLPDEDGLILPDRVLTFTCDRPGSKLNGSLALICGTDGKWDNPIPNCIEVMCKLPAQIPRRLVVGAEVGSVAVGHRVTVKCENEHSSRQIECLPTGQWSTKFPSCTDGQGCGPPPLLKDGDSLTLKTQFSQNERVEYLCQDRFVMQGGPFKTCYNGEWTGEITCLKPCTVDSTLMDSLNIKFKYGYKNKLYAPHDDFLTFTCKPGTTHDGEVAMRQGCQNGLMLLPRCI